MTAGGYQLPLASQSPVLGRVHERSVPPLGVLRISKVPPDSDGATMTKLSRDASRTAAPDEMGTRPITARSSGESQLS